MRQSKLFTKTLKHLPKDEASSNAQLLLKGGYIDKLMAGVYSILPLGWAVVNRLEAIIRSELNSIGAQEVFLPALQPKELWSTTGRWETMKDILYTVQQADQEYTLGSTHEEVVVPLMQKFVHSYKDLPVAVYQFQTKFRRELRPKSGILRGREFLMKDQYSFHASVEDLDRYYDMMKQVYQRIFQQVGLGDVTHLTFASGGAFSKYSHEYQTVTPAGEDTIYICQQCQLAINREIKADTPVCPQCQGQEFIEQRAIEVGNIFKLMAKFTEPFNFMVAGADGKPQPVIMGCYGIGIGRMLGTIVEIHHDAHGIIWPEAVSPYTFHLLNLHNDSVQADQVYTTLQLAGHTVLFDDRAVSAGIKFADADLLGLPIRLVVSPKTQGKIEYRRRVNDTTALVGLDELVKRHVQ